MKKKPIRAVIATVVISSMVVGTALAAPSSSELEQKKETLEQQKSAKQKEVEQYQSQYTSLVNKIDELEASIIETGEEATQAQEDLDVAEEKADKQNDDMRLRIKFMYESGGDMGMMASFLESNDFTEMVTNAEYVQNVHEYDRNKLEEYKETLEEVKVLKETLDQKLSDLEDQQEEFQTKKDEVNTLLDSAKGEVSSLNSEIQQAILEAEAARQEEARIAAENAERERAASAVVSQQPSRGGVSRPSVSTPAPQYQGQGDTAIAQAIVSAAYSQLGVPYVWGGTSPGSGLDCSGLTQYAHRVAGISIPRTSGAQLGGGQIVSNPQPGDICWTPGHVAIYIGGGQMIEAPQPGDVVKISSVRVSVYVRYW